MRVLFVYPSIDCPPGINHGLAAMSGVLKSEGHETRLVHVCDELWQIPSYDDILARIEEYNPQVIGYSVMSQQYSWAKKLAEYVKIKRPDIVNVVGGVHVTMVPDEVMKDNAAWDVVMPGEADFTFLELVNRIERGKSYHDAPACRIPAKDGREAIVNPVSAYPDLSTLPPKDYELFDLDHIIRTKKGWFSIITSRGCPYKCTYCFNWEIVEMYKEDGAIKSSKEYLRHYSTDRIIREILTMKRDYPHIGTIIFDDDLFTLNKPYVLEFTKAYKESGIDLPFVVNAHVQRFDDEMALALKDAGCIIVKYGLESGSQDIRQKVLMRFMPNKKIIESFRAAQRHDLHTSAFIMFGLPGVEENRFETREQVEETLQICADIEMGRFRWALFYPFPGTAGYAQAVEKNLIDWDKWRSVGNYFDGSCLDFSPGHNLYLQKLGALCNWYVNARTSWPSKEIYQKLVNEVEAMDAETFQREKDALIKHDRELSEELIKKGWRHYSIRYASVMGVDSDYIIWEREQQKKQMSLQTVTYTLD
ncbi:MAG: B12-binding domain-containing radical SAM protein [Planctomycetes bacterium]|nr:B12-binding domain-containing radical SAM protein [Planctomycetota bacterium]